MFVSHGIQPVSLAFTNTKNCFLNIPSSLATQLRLQENQAIELSWGLHQPVFLSWTRCQRSAFLEENVVEINRQLGDKLGIKDREQAFLRPCFQVLSMQQVFVEPLSSDDWEILELHSSTLEQRLLDQIRIVYPNGVFPVWVDQHTVIYIKIGSLTPVAPYGRLEQLTELIVSPKLRQTEDSLSDFSSQAGRNPDVSKFQSTYGDRILDIPATKSALGTKMYEGQAENIQNIPGNQKVSTSGRITDLKSLIRYMFTGSTDSNKEIPSVPSIPSVLTDSVFRVCRSSPFSTDQQNTAYVNQATTVHILPWNHQSQDGDCCQFVITYGKLTKLLSPNELKEKAKLNMLQPDKRKSSGNSANATGKQSPSGHSQEDIEPTVVRIICHGAEDQEYMQRFCYGNEKLYCGKVWIPESLRRRLNIEVCAAVRLRPLKSTPTIASTVRLQPLQTLPHNVNDQDVRSAFLDGLQAQRNDEMSWLTGRVSYVQLPVNEAQVEFCLTVIMPEAVSCRSDEIFLLSSSLIQETDIQVMMQPRIKKADTITVKDDIDQTLSFSTLRCLGGVEEVGRTAFEHIIYSLRGRPLSQELLSVAPGLRNGALLLTGPKGSGKTALAKALCREAADKLDAYVEVIDCKQLRGKHIHAISMSQYSGKRCETVRKKLEEAFAEAVWRQPSLLLLDDLDHIAGAASSPEQEQGPEALLGKQLAQALTDLASEAVVHGSLIALIATSQSERSLHPSLVSVQGSHFFQCFTSIKPPSQVQRNEILRAVIQNKSSIAEETWQVVDTQSLARETEGFVARDFTLLVERAIHASVVNNRGTSAQDLFLATCDFQQALKGFTPSSLRNANLHTPKDLGWERVGGLHEARQQLMDTIQLPAKYPALFANLPIRQQSGVLLYGAPGTGKTLLAAAVANESGMNFISIKGPELLSKYIGASEQAVRDVFNRAQAAKPCILFFDEFDSIAPRRGHDNTGVTDRVVNQMLTQLDGVEGLQGVYVLAATSRPDLIDPALLRPGRLDKSLYCPPPDQGARKEILDALSLTVPLAEDVDFDVIAANTEFFTGADLKALLYNAQLEAIHTNLAACLLDMGSGSDSDVSLSSMIFLNHSSGSDDSSGEVEGGLERSVVCLDSSELLPEDPRQNAWRLYFGSSYESELGNQTPSELCLSGPNSMTHDITGASIRDVASCQMPVLMSSLQEGYQELNQEQAEQLRAEINNIRSNYRNRHMEEQLHLQSGPSKPAVLICQSHLLTALSNTRPSIPQQDWANYTDLYNSFGNSREGKSQGAPNLKAGQRVTLA
ncbi:peroxisome biogenesis factor 1 isoform X1 [Acipenser oxyrinchus oxyrinchus]|uniref:Peroxisomal ATPase PEX1 n=1 Tax=Acipenser oxyrinchus oxyrinchus TaxID=40147 RepID=A0AAD8GEE3_ACIOX|nr:peroxisome biogenesis factor 1 isoform X1 [Acipenser oxyrinchus oxyrinchus]